MAVVAVMMMMTMMMVMMMMMTMMMVMMTVVAMRACVRACRELSSRMTTVGCTLHRYVEVMLWDVGAQEAAEHAGLEWVRRGPASPPQEQESPGGGGSAGWHTRRPTGGSCVALYSYLWGPWLAAL